MAGLALGFAKVGAVRKRRRGVRGFVRPYGPRGATRKGFWSAEVFVRGRSVATAHSAGRTPQAAARKLALDYWGPGIRLVRSSYDADRATVGYEVLRDGREVGGARAWWQHNVPPRR